MLPSKTAQQLTSSRDTYVARIRAATAVRTKTGKDIVIIARTDALQPYGYDDAVRRLRAAISQGADVAFLEGITSKDMARQITKDLAPTPVLLNMVENGATPTIPVDEAREMGFRLIIFPFAAIAPAYEAIKSTMEKLKKQGLTGIQDDFTPRKLFEICGLEESMAIDAAAGGKSFANGA